MKFNRAADLICRLRARPKCYLARALEAHPVQLAVLPAQVFQVGRGAEVSARREHGIKLRGEDGEGDEGEGEDEEVREPVAPRPEAG